MVSRSPGSGLWFDLLSLQPSTIVCVLLLLLHNRSTTTLPICVLAVSGFLCVNSWTWPFTKTKRNVIRSSSGAWLALCVRCNKSPAVGDSSSQDHGGHSWCGDGEMKFDSNQRLKLLLALHKRWGNPCLWIVGFHCLVLIRTWPLICSLPNVLFPVGTTNGYSQNVLHFKRSHHFNLS